MRTLITITATIIVAFMCGYHTGNVADKKQQELINAYELYKSGAEELLDSLDNRYNWVDSYDVYDYYDGLHKVDSLLILNN